VASTVRTIVGVEPIDPVGDAVEDGVAIGTGAAVTVAEGGVSIGREAGADAEAAGVGGDGVVAQALRNTPMTSANRNGACPIDRRRSATRRPKFTPSLSRTSMKPHAMGGIDVIAARRADGSSTQVLRWAIPLPFTVGQSHPRTE